MVGSSRKRTRGLCSSAAAISQRMRWPSESWRSGVSSTGAIFSISTDGRACGRSAPAPRDRYRAKDRSSRRSAGPPQLRALAEHHADPRDMGDAALPRHQAADLAASRARAQDPRQDLDRGRFARAVRPDEAEKLAFLERETHPVERRDLFVPAPEEAAEGAGKARIARRDAIGFAEILDLYLGHLSHSPKRRPRRTGNPATVSTRQIGRGTYCGRRGTVNCARGIRRCSQAPAMLALHPVWVSPDVIFSPFARHGSIPDANSSLSDWRRGASDTKVGA